jgi:hypothetical protein
MTKEKAITPKVGMGATEYCWSDTHPWTVIKLIGLKTIVVQRDESIRTDNNGLSESQEYIYERNPEGPTRILTLRKNGVWIVKGESMKGKAFGIGHRREYYDPCF